MASQADTFIVEATIRHADGSIEYVNTTYNTDGGITAVSGWLDERAHGGTITRSVIRRRVEGREENAGNIGAPWRDRQAPPTPYVPPKRLDDAADSMEVWVNDYVQPTLYVQGSLEGGDSAAT